MKYFALLFVFFGAGVVSAAQKPNVVIIYADDLGYGDVQCYNPERGKIPTPEIDRLATQGMRFTDAHSSSSVCSPSRYTLLTGRYHWRTRLQNGIVATWGAPLIAPDRLTIATLAKKRGYRTACIGKWHLGLDWPIAEEHRPHFAKVQNPQASPTAEQRAAWRETFSRPIPGGPTERGFDQYFGTDVPNWPPFCFIEQDRTVGIPTEFLPQEKHRRQLASVQGPALTDWEFEPILPTLIERATAFIAKSAASDDPYLLYLPLTSPHTPLAVNAAWKGKSGLESAVADLIMETDAAVGRVLAAIDESGEADSTLVLFSSDNGFAPYVGAAQLEQRGHFPSGPLRGYKADVYEGGHRIPFMVRWPGVVKAGAVCQQLVHQADVMATLAEILDFPLPDNAGEDSISLLPLLKGSSTPVRQNAVSCAASGVPGFRMGQWKLILSSDKKSKSDVQLYDLGNDLGEKTNLADEDPGRVDKMRKAFEQLIVAGRTTTGSPQKNDVAVRRFPVAASPNQKKPKKK